MASIQGIYIALFGRPADPAGLEFFNTATGNGANLTAIGDLAASAEYQSRFEGLDNIQIINSIYQSLFGRDADLAGLNFFAAELAAGRQTINTIAINIYDGAKGDDATVLDNKETAANAFTASIDTGPEVVAYRGDTAAEAGRAFLAPITVDPATVPTATATTAAVQAITDGTSTGGTGQIFTLTAAGAGVSGIDVVNGTAGDDTIRAVDASSLTSGDVIHGGNGFDTLNITSATGFTLTTTPVIDGVERINSAVTGGANILDLSSITGLEQLWSSGAVATYTNGSLDVVYGASGAVAQTINVDLTGTLAGVTTVDLASTLAAGINGTFDFGTDAANIEIVSVNSVSGAGTVTLDPDLNNLTEIDVTGAGRLTVVSTEATLTKFDASGNTGGVTYISGATTEAVAVTGSSGNDSLNFSNATAASAVTLDAGAGNDVVTGGLGKDVLTGGAGNDIINGGANADTLTGGAGNDTFVYLAAADSNGTTVATIDHITDFTTGADTLDLSGVALLTGFTSAQDQIDIENAITGLAPGSTLAQAIVAVDAITTIGEVATFVFDGNTYVYGDDNATDILVQLTGIVPIANSDIAVN